MEILERMTDWLWSGPILFALLFTHLYMTVRLKVPQRKLPLALKLSITAADEKQIQTETNTDQIVVGKEQVSQTTMTQASTDQHQRAAREGFRALAMTLAATLGTGNIVGVSTAVVLGGPGAVLWCWLTGVLGMATAYGECYLGMLYRERDEEGHLHGGPMYALEKGLKNHRLAVAYAACVVVSAFGIGAGTQSGALAGAVQTAWQVDEGVTGALAALLTGLVILGDVKKIGRWCERLVPVAGICYIGGCLCILVLSAHLILPALGLIIKSAFTPTSICAGVAGGGLSLSLRYGVARGLFTNEAGLGTASISAATSSAPPKTQSLIQMSAVFWDTVVMCALTGLVVVVGLLAAPVSQGQPELTAHAFSRLPVFGTDFLAACMAAFALATLIGWSYFGEEACRFLHLPALGYKLIYLFMIFAGAVLPMKFVWCVTDLVNALLIIPSLTCLYGLKNQIEEP